MVGRVEIADELQRVGDRLDNVIFADQGHTGGPRCGVGAALSRSQPGPSKRVLAAGPRNPLSLFAPS